MNAPKNIWICAAGKDVPEWVVERMTTAEVATDGSFDIEASDGVIRVEAGFAVFEVGHDVYACAPKGIPEKPAAVDGDHEAVAELTAKVEADSENRSEDRMAARAEPE